MNRRFLLLLSISLYSIFPLIAQSSASHAHVDSVHKQDITFQQALEEGKVNGYFRSFFMATDNARQLTDYYALALGGKIKYKSEYWHGFSFGLGAVFAYNLVSSDLGEKDSITGVGNRYEIGLFDLEDPENRNDIDRVEEMWIRYKWNHSSITIGQQSLQTPFINFQDGRMRPSAQAGVWAELNDLKDIKIQTGWLWSMSPRSTVRWYDVGESIGVYPKGLNPDGSASGYAGNLESKGIVLLGVSGQLGKHINYQFWNQYVENIFNTMYGRADMEFPLKNQHAFVGGLMLIHQDALKDGGHEESSKSYFIDNGKSNALSIQTGWRYKGWQALAAYTHVTSDGRFLSPREWGREPFYTFIQRERIEGSGGSNSFSARLRWQNKPKNLEMEVAYGHFYLPDVRNARLNKYGFPSFNQFNLNMQYSFTGFLNGLKVQVIYVYKDRLGEVYGQEKYVINKVEMSHYNFIVNYIF